MEINSGLPFSSIMESTLQFCSVAIHYVRLLNEGGESSRFAWVVTGAFDSIEAGHQCTGAVNMSKNMEIEYLMRLTG